MNLALILSLGILSIPANYSFAASPGFTDQQIFFLTNNDPGRGPLGAEIRAQYIYHYFKKDRDSKLITPPAWVDETLDAMLQHQVWRDPEEGILNEAQLWQAPVAVLYEFFQTTHKTFPSQYPGGAMVPPPALLADYEDSRTRFQIALERLYRARLGDSMQGRGRAVLANFDLILKEMNSLLDALTSQDQERYRESVMAVGYLTRSAFNVLQEPPRGWVPPGSRFRSSPTLSTLFMMIGTFLVFAAGWSFGTLKEEEFHAQWAEFLKKSRERASDFNRQFVQVKVQYMVLIPVVAGIVLGIFTFNIWGFLLLTVLGVLVGLKLPAAALDFIRRLRGKRVEAQLMDAMILLSNALKSGLDIVQGFELVSRDLLPPISEEFGLVIKNYRLGTPFDRALEGMEERISSRLISYVIKAVIIQRSVGGNLTKIFDRIVDNIREEGKLEEKMQALTAQQRIQSVVVGIMPWGMVTIMFLFQPEMMAKYYFSPLGFLTVFFCVIWMSIGMGIVRKLADIQV